MGVAAGMRKAKKQKSRRNHMQPTREQALEWLKDYNESETLRRHALTVEGCMRHFAALCGEDVERGRS